MACAQRYWVVLLGFIGLLLSIGYRAVFSMVIVHVMKAKHNTTDADDSIYPTKCTTTGTNRNLEVEWPAGIGILFQTAYFISSTLTQIPGGMLAVRFSAKRVCGLSILASGILLMVMPAAIERHYGFVFAIRIVQGVIEDLCTNHVISGITKLSEGTHLDEYYAIITKGVTVPSLNGVIAAWAPKSEKSRLITISYAGAYLSTAVAMVVSGACMCYVTWYAALILYGGLGTVWSVVWLCTVYDSPSLCPYLSDRERELFDREGNKVRAGSRETSAKVPWKQIFTSLPVSAVFVGAFCRNWIFSMLIVEEPQYLKDVYHMSTPNIGLFSSIPHVLMTIVVIIGGFMFDYLIKGQIISTTVARKLAQCIGFGVEAVCILGLGFITDWKLAIILLSVGVAISGLAISGYQVNPLDLSPQYASILTGIARLGASGAIISTLLASQTTNKGTLQEWQLVFLISAVVHFCGVIYYGIFASGNRQSWAEDQTEKILPNVLSTGSLESLVDEERERLLTKSYNFVYDSDDAKDKLWFTSTI